MFESTQGDSGYDIAKTNVPDNVNSLIGDANTLSDPNASHSLALNNQEDKTFEDILYSFTNNSDPDTLETTAITGIETGNNGDSLIGKEYETDDLTGQEANELDDGNITTASLDSSSIVTNRSRADLRVTFQSAPSIATAGSTISVRSWVRNSGFGTAGSSTLRYYLSDDAKLDANDTLQNLSSM